MINIEPLDATRFEEFKNFYFNEFKVVLKLLIHCYKQIVLNERFVSNESENHLRNILVKKYLRNPINKEKFGLEYVGFEIEPGEFGDSCEVVGFIDIKVTNAGLPYFGKCDENTYYAIECKRLNEGDKIGVYIKEGIMRFVVGKYSKYMSLAGMVGFVENGNIIEIVNRINERLRENTVIKTKKLLKQLIIEQNFNHSYQSGHKRDKNRGEIALYHLMFDYTNLYFN